MRRDNAMNDASPGPWQVQAGIVFDRNGHEIVEMCPEAEHRRIRANLVLICATWELHKIAEELSGGCTRAGDGWHVNSGVMHDLDRVLAKLRQ